ncbi:phospholipase SGR2-like isoform X1 [Silene latifolia]|uniref:phospholipase SGR2-like isoform X1 n=1 Tax=Silene latifolia TaxID=37657 RepID=UPI003D77BC50
MQLKRNVVQPKRGPILMFKYLKMCKKEIQGFKNKQGMQVLHALFTGEDPTWEAWLNVDTSGFSGIANLGGNGIKLRRGYAAFPSPKPTQDELCQQKEEEMDDYCSQVRQISCSLYPYFICRALLYAA